MNFIQDKIKLTCEQIRQRIITEERGIENILFAKCRYKTSNIPDENLKWSKYENGTWLLFEKDSHAWFSFETEIPAVSNDEKWFLKICTGREGQGDSLNPQGMLFINGDTCLQGFDVNHTEYMLTPGKKSVRIYFYGGMKEPDLNIRIHLVKKNMSADNLFWDISVPFEAMKQLDTNSYAYTEICNSLDKTCMLVDFRNTENFFESVKKADKFLEAEFYDKICGKDTRGEIAFIGHTHIDVAWLWTLAQTEEKTQRSFSTVTRLMELYPDYIFMSSQPQLYAYVKKNDPALYKKIKNLIKQGRWEPEGAMWLESDTNLVSGESLVRQLLYGKKFMKEEFGIENRILWLPDVFGYSAALPQILLKCGVDRFFTTKISWNETNKFPHDNFIWQGIDGSEVFAVLSNGYVNKLDPKTALDFLNTHQDKKYTETHIVTYGFGDGGGGPTVEMLENYERLKRGIPGFPKVSQKRAGHIIEEIREQFEKSTKELKFTPKWSGELYLEYHRGTYTSMAKNKKNNRRCEFLYQKTEAAAVSSKILTGAEYPKAELDENWLTILKNQFHDIIPGSSIKEVYEDSDREYAEVLTNGERMFDKALCDIADLIKTDGGILVYNPSPFTATTVTECDGKVFFAENIPAHGYAVINPSDVPTTVFATPNSMENEFLKVSFDEKYHIISLYDKTAKRELIPEGQAANVLEVFEDYPRKYDAWEISQYYSQKKWIADDVRNVSLIKEPLYAGVSITRTYGNSLINQKIILKHASARLDFITDVDWKEDHVLLKAAFPFDIRSGHATHEIQFGHIERPTHKNTSWDEAKFEVCSHKWADLSEDGYGVALLNDCKYGYCTEENIIKLSLLKAATHPNPVADREQHSFTYSLLPHNCPLSGSDVVKEGYLLNMPFTVKKIAANKNASLPCSFSLVSSNKKNAVVDTIKQAEDGNGYIVRLYNSQNNKTDVTLTFGFDLTEAHLCDMTENTEKKVETTNRNISFKLKNFEVLTFRIIP